MRALFTDPAVGEAWIAQWLARIEGDGVSASERRSAMDAVNPVYIPRNHKVEEALAAAIAGDMAPYQRLLEAVTDPFVERDGFAEYAEPAPDSFGRYVTFCGT